MNALVIKLRCKYRAVYYINQIILELLTMINGRLFTKPVSRYIFILLSQKTREFFCLFRGLAYLCRRKAKESCVR